MDASTGGRRMLCTLGGGPCPSLPPPLVTPMRVCLRLRVLSLMQLTVTTLCNCTTGQRFLCLFMIVRQHAPNKWSKFKKERKISLHFFHFSVHACVSQYLLTKLVIALDWSSVRLHINNGRSSARNVCESKKVCIGRNFCR